MTLIEELQKRTAKYIDAHIYDLQQWQAREEVCGNQADYTLAAEGSLHHILNGYLEPEEGDLTYEELNKLAEEHGYTLVQGYSWSWHFYSNLSSLCADPPLI